MCPLCCRSQLTKQSISGTYQSPGDGGESSGLPLPGAGYSEVRRYLGQGTGFMKPLFVWVSVLRPGEGRSEVFCEAGVTGCVGAWRGALDSWA